MNITSAQAENIIDAAKAKALELGAKVNIAVVDSGSNLIAFAGMDGEPSGTIEIAQKKANTANWFFMDTKTLTPPVPTENEFFNVEDTNGGLVTRPGGVVLKNNNGDVVGAIGVSGGTAEDDHEVACAGAERFKLLTPCIG